MKVVMPDCPHWQHAQHNGQLFTPSRLGSLGLNGVGVLSGGTISERSEVSRSRRDNRLSKVVWPGSSSAEELAQWCCFLIGVVISETDTASFMAEADWKMELFR